MQLDAFDYVLPEELIASHPLEKRSDSRLLHLDSQSGEVIHRQFLDLQNLLRPGDLLVMNNTRVVPARLKGRKATGGQVEVMLERMLDDQAALVQIRASKSPRAGTFIELDQAQRLEVKGREGSFYRVHLSTGPDLAQVFREQGSLPLPHYMQREAEVSDLERYQTVYAEKDGAVAAPTAGLHFTTELLSQLQQQGVGQTFLTLHVGAGTFQPVRCSDVTAHQMHGEYIEVSESLVNKVLEARAAGGRIVAVGTTVVRALESAARSGELRPYFGETDIFIYPGFRFQMIDALITNFHLPRSTLLMLVSALAGREHILAAYAEAVALKYRFFSYGDAMFIEAGGRP